MIFDDDNIELELVLNTGTRLAKPTQRPKQQADKPRNKYEAEVEANLVLNMPKKKTFGIGSKYYDDMRTSK
ncbi:hypothetical protein ACQCVK_02875 [Rossellomorea vietnamensis]|uniref:hypothetical protein n=1 Tax=Rossellomorea vietnamensis TaxID=218284 RepID=UPI003CF07453